MKKVSTNYLLFLWLLLFGQLHSQVWEPVGSATGISTGSAGRMTLVNDKQNNLVLGYYDVVATKGSVQKFDGSNWSYLGGSPGITPASTGAYNSTSVDSNGTVYFTSQAGTTGLEVRKFENNNWVQLPNVTNNTINFNTSAVSPDNVLYVASNEGFGTVKKLINGQWQQVGAVGFASALPYFLDMVVGSNGKVYVSFNNGGNVHVYENDINASSTTAWQPVGGIANLAPAPNTEDFNSSIAIDSNNNLYLSYVSNAASGNKLNVKKFNGNVWAQLGSENFSQFRAKHTSIALGANNIVYVAMSKFETDNQLRNFVLAYNETTNTWSQAGTGFASTGPGIFNSLSVDSFGNLFLAYIDNGLSKVVVKKLNLGLIAAESIVIKTQNNVPAEINQNKGSLQLEATVFPQGSNQNVIWTVEKGAGFVTLSSSGLVTAIASDTTVTIKATSAENSSISSTFDVVIKNQDSDVDAQSISVRTLNNVDPDIDFIGGTLQLLAEVKPAEADQKFTWSIQQGSDKVSINSNGLVTAIADGFAIIRATHIDGVLFKDYRVNVFANGCSQGNPMPNFKFGYTISNTQGKGIDDFKVTKGTRFTISKIRMNIASTAQFQNIPFNVNFYKDNDGIPGELIKSFTNIQLVSQERLGEPEVDIYQYIIEMDLPEAISFDEGTYWVNPVALTNVPVYWSLNIAGIGNPFLTDDFDGNGWRPRGGTFQAVFKLSGNCTMSPLVVESLNGADSTIFIGEDLSLKATINTPGVSQNVVWTVAEGNASVSIDQNGLVKGLKAGKSVIKATSTDNESISGIFKVTVLDPNACAREAVSNNRENASVIGGATQQRLAVDFEVQGTGSTFKIDSVEPQVANFATSFTFIVYKDENGLPGAEVSRSNGQIVRDVVTGIEFFIWFHHYTVKLENEITLPEGKYWLEMVTDAQGWESTTVDIQGQSGAFYNTNTNQWNFVTSGSEFVYKINGVCKTDNDMAVTEESLSHIQYYPNPVKDVLNITSDDKLVNVVIYNMVGQKVFEKSLSESKAKVNMTNLLNGTYIVEAISNNGDKKRFKIIKN